MSAASRVSHDKLESLSRPSTLRWLLRVALNWIEIIGSIYLIGKLDRWAAYLFGLFIVATRQHALGILAHEGTHYCVAKNHKINDRLTKLFVTWPLMVDLENYRLFHLAHHTHSGTEEDSELFHKRKFQKEWKVPLPPGKMVGLLLKDVFGWGARNLIIVVGKIGVRRPSNVAGALLWWGAVSGGLFFIGRSWWVAYFWAAQWIFFWAIFRARMWTEHVGTEGTYRLQASPVWRFLILPHYTWYHYEHHKYPSVPCWNFPRLRAEDLKAEGSQSIKPSSVKHVLRSLGQHSPENEDYFGRPLRPSEQKVS